MSASHEAQLSTYADLITDYRTRLDAEFAGVVIVIGSLDVIAGLPASNASVTAVERCETITDLAGRLIVIGQTNDFVQQRLAHVVMALEYAAANPCVQPEVLLLQSLHLKSAAEDLSAASGSIRVVHDEIVALLVERPEFETVLAFGDVKGAAQSYFRGLADVRDWLAVQSSAEGAAESGLDAIAAEVSALGATVSRHGARSRAERLESGDHQLHEAFQYINATYTTERERELHAQVLVWLQADGENADHAALRWGPADVEQGGAVCN